LEELDELLDIVIAQRVGGSSIVRPRFAGIARLFGVQRFALEIFSRALPCDPPSFRLIWEPRFAELSANPKTGTL